jgi:hypothetical protein
LNKLAEKDFQIHIKTTKSNFLHKNKIFGLSAAVVVAAVVVVVEIKKIFYL